MPTQTLLTPLGWFMSVVTALRGENVSHTLITAGKGALCSDHAI